MTLVNLSKNPKLVVDPDFQELLPALSDDESETLEKALIKAGTNNEPIKTWGGIILDGHNRYRLLTKNGLPVAHEEIDSIKTRDEALEWILENQLGRRNLSPEAYSYFRGKMYEVAKKAAEAQPKAKGGKEKTVNKIASKTGVAPRTISRDAEFASGTDKLGKALGSQEKAKVLSGKSDLTKHDVQALAKTPEKEVAAKVTTIRQTKAAAKSAPKASVNIGPNKPLPKAGVTIAPAGETKPTLSVRLDLMEDALSLISEMRGKLMATVLTDKAFMAEVSRVENALKDRLTPGYKPAADKPKDEPVAVKPTLKTTPKPLAKGSKPEDEPDLPEALKRTKDKPVDNRSSKTDFDAIADAMAKQPSA